ncbi:MAG: methyltransferase type 11 [Acidobacteria bacterium 13_1_40CM_3_55_6]|nr:MAG: methyltransferase type 11 [Acidobacteria bacterium 13_1_40CM_3_55_6]
MPASKFMSVRQAYSDWAATYDVDRNLTRDLDQAVTRNILANLHCKSVLELGCGTGKNTALLAEIGERVRAVDFSQSMIERAKDKLRLNNVSFEVADITEPWPCASESYDLIVCNLVLEHIRDLSFIFAEAFRVLVTQGRFFLCELHPTRQYAGKQANFQRNGKMTPIEAFVHHLTDFTDAANDCGFSLQSMKEWWHEEDELGH